MVAVIHKFIRTDILSWHMQSCVVNYPGAGRLKRQGAKASSTVSIVGLFTATRRRELRGARCPRRLLPAEREHTASGNNNKRGRHYQ